MFDRFFLAWDTSHDLRFANADVMKVELCGEWRVVLDPSERGLVEKWDQLGLKTADKLCLPGTLTEGGFGDVPGVDTQWTGSIYDRSWFHDPELAQYRSSVPPHFPFWLTPNKRYVGVAWYEREITIAESWVGVPFRIALERAHWQTCLWVDGECLGSGNSLCVPHVFEHAGVQTPGVHRLTLRVDNAIREIHPGQDAHSITDHTQGNWNGVVGEMTLEFSTHCGIALGAVGPRFQGKCFEGSWASQWSVRDPWKSIRTTLQ